MPDKPEPSPLFYVDEVVSTSDSAPVDITGTIIRVTEDAAGATFVYAIRNYDGFVYIIDEKDIERATPPDLCRIVDKDTNTTFMPIRVTLTFECGEAQSGFAQSAGEALLIALNKHSHFDRNVISVPK